LGETKEREGEEEEEREINTRRESKRKKEGQQGKRNLIRICGIHNKSI
jgi:hypothetical protein